MRSQQDNWEEEPPSKVKPNESGFVRVIRYDNLVAMCARFKGEKKFTVQELVQNRVRVTCHDSVGEVSVYFKTNPCKYFSEDRDNPLVYLWVLKVEEGRKPSVQARFEVLLTATSLWRDPTTNSWSTHAEIRQQQGTNAITEGKTYCAVCLEEGNHRYVKPGDVPGTFVHDVNKNFFQVDLDQDHEAVPSDKWYDPCTFCDCEGGNSGSQKKMKSLAGDKP